MSHFTVLVIWDDVESALAPFDENLDVPQYIKYTREQLIEKSKQEIQEYKDGLYARYLSDPIKYAAECSNADHIEFLKNEFPNRLSWSDEEHYQNEIRFYEPEEIWSNWEILSTRNPNGEWDWWQIGWRWAGKIIVKPGTTFETPNFSWGWSAEEKQKVLETLRTDSALLKDIDFEAMSADSIKNFTERFSLLQKWDELPFDIKIMKFWNSSNERDFINSRHTLEEYLNEFVPHPLSAYAYIYQDKWIVKWDMLSFGISVPNQSEWEWKAKFTEFINGLDPETRITFVDCHV